MKYLSLTARYSAQRLFQPTVFGGALSRLDIDQHGPRLRRLLSRHVPRGQCLNEHF